MYRQKAFSYLCLLIKTLAGNQEQMLAFVFAEKTSWRHVMAIRPGSPVMSSAGPGTAARDSLIAPSAVGKPGDASLPSNAHARSCLVMSDYPEWRKPRTSGQMGLEQLNDSPLETLFSDFGTAGEVHSRFLAKGVAGTVHGAALSVPGYLVFTPCPSKWQGIDRLPPPIMLCIGQDPALRLLLVTSLWLEPSSPQ